MTRDHGQQPVSVEHEEQNADQRDDGRDDLGQAHLQGHGDVFYIVGHTGENIAPGMRIKIFDGQLLQLDVDGLAHVIDEILGHIDHNELLNEVADHRERIEKAHDNGGVPQTADLLLTPSVMISTMSASLLGA